MTDKKEEGQEIAAGPLTIVDGPIDDGRISCPRHGRQTYVTFGDGVGWMSERHCFRCHCEAQIESIRKYQESKVKEEPKDGEEIPDGWDDWILDWANYDTAGVPKDLVDYIDTEGRIPLAVGKHPDGRYFLVTEASILLGWWDDIRRFDPRDWRRPEPPIAPEPEVRVGRFGPMPESNPELTKLLKDAKPATEGELRAQRRGYAGLRWKVPHRWFSSNEYLKRGDAMISAIVALGDKVTDDEEERLFSRIQNLSCAIRNDPKGYAGTDQMAKHRMYVAAHALRRRITPLADEAAPNDTDG